jgi:hypothetical protein
MDEINNHTFFLFVVNLGNKPPWIFFILNLYSYTVSVFSLVLAIYFSES